MSLRRHSLALLAAGQPLPLTGRLLVDGARRAGEVAVDGQSGAEVSPLAGTWVLSDEGEASDGNIVLQEWDLSRDRRSGINILYHHGQDPVLGAAVLGRWIDLQVQTGLPDTTGRALTARIEWARDLPPAAAHIPGQVEQGMLRGVSVGWIPGSMTPRGSLHPDDPHYRESQDDGCGLAEEGYVMGSKDEPNELVETSLTPTPAQSRAYARARLQEGGERAASALLEGRQVRAGDFDRLLALLHDHPKVRAMIKAREDALVARVRAELGQTHPNPAERPFWRRSR